MKHNFDFSTCTCAECKPRTQPRTTEQESKTEPICAEWSVAQHARSPLQGAYPVNARTAHDPAEESRIAHGR